MLTGEAQPAERGIGERIFAATLLLKGYLPQAIKVISEAFTTNGFLEVALDVKQAEFVRFAEQVCRNALPLGLLLSGR